MLKQSEIVQEIVEKLFQAAIISQMSYITARTMIANYLLDNNLRIEGMSKTEVYVSKEEHEEALWGTEYYIESDGWNT